MTRSAVYGEGKHHGCQHQVQSEIPRCIAAGMPVCAREYCPRYHTRRTRDNVDSRVCVENVDWLHVGAGERERERECVCVCVCACVSFDLFGKQVDLRHLHNAMCRRLVQVNGRRRLECAESDA